MCVFHIQPFFLPVDIRAHKPHLEPRSRFGAKFTQITSSLFPKRDCAALKSRKATRYVQSARFPGGDFSAALREGHRNRHRGRQRIVLGNSVENWIVCGNSNTCIPGVLCKYTSKYVYQQGILEKIKNVSCEIEDFVETRLRKLRGILRLYHGRSRHILYILHICRNSKNR